MTGPPFVARINLASNETLCQLRAGIAIRTRAENFKVMAVDSEMGGRAKFVDDLIDGTSRKRYGRAAAGTDKMMSMPRFPGDIGGVSARLQDPGAEIE